MIISDGKKIKVYNGTATTISSDRIVIVKGKKAILASYTNNDCKVYPLGYTLGNISPGQYGEVVLEGSILNVNTTNTGPVNSILYLNTNGHITITKPAIPIIIGTISKDDLITGEIYFKVYSPSVAAWGDLVGDLTDQTDLQNALDNKFDNPTGTTSDYIRGDGSIAAFPTTSGIPHGTATASVSDTYTTTITGVTAYNDADAYLIRFTTGNTTSATLNINSLGAIPLYRNNDGVLIGGDIIDGAEMLCVYNSTTNRFQVIGTAPNTLLAYVTNVDSVTITKGQPVYAFGGQGDRLTVKRAFNTTDATSAQTVGLVLSSSIGVNQKGLIMVNGLLDGLSILPTSTFADGDAIYLGATAGTITNVKPTAPNHLVYLGFCTTANNGSAGRMYVRVQNGYELQELHNVQAQSPSLKDTLYYDNGISPGQWKTASISTILGYTPQQQLNLTTTGTSGAATLVGSTLNIPQYSGGTSQTLLQKAALGYEYYNDFLSTPTLTGTSDGVGYIFFFSGTSSSIIASTAPGIRASNQHGFIRPTTGTQITGYAGFYGGAGGNQFLLGGGAMTFTTSVLFNTLSTPTERYRVTIGYGDQATNAAEVNGIFFTYDEGATANGTTASANWQCVTTVGSVRTLTTTTTAVSTAAWQKLDIEINAGGTSVTFYIDDVLVATHTTNIPSGTSQLITPKGNIAKAVGTVSRFYHIDYIYYAQTYTTTKFV